MAAEKVSSLVQELIENNRKTSKHLVKAYRVGGTQTFEKIGKGIERALEGRVKLNAKVRDNVLAASERVTELGARGVDKISDGADKAVDTVCDGASTAIDQFVSRVGKIDNKYAEQYFDFVNRVTLPGVRFARDLSDRVVEGAAKVSQKVGGASKPAAKRRAAPKRKPKPVAAAAVAAS